MTTSESIEDQCVRLWHTVYGNVGQTEEEARVAFLQQEPAIIEGWKRLARSIYHVTTAQTLDFILTKQA